MKGKKARIILILCMLPIISLFLGCATAFIPSTVPAPPGLHNAAAGNHNTPIIPPPGFIYSSYRAPIDINYKETGTGQLLKVSHKKTQFLRIWFPILSFGWGEVDIKSIAEREGIKKVAYVDYELFNILELYKTFTINVYGYGE